MRVTALPKKVILAISAFFLLYLFFWLSIFHISPFSSQLQGNIQSPVPPQIAYRETPQRQVFSVEASSIPEVKQVAVEELPPSFYTNLSSRRQKYNLSCEFAAAAAIVHYYTKNPEFVPENEMKAEEILMKQVGISQNPNIGIRMGISVPQTLESLYVNLNQRFGGADYYGVHAPPFISVFPEYGLAARPIANNAKTIEAMKKALFANHLIMAWIKLGQGNPVDVTLSYGSATVVKGEHSIVVNGYNEKGWWVLDPASGEVRNIAYGDFLYAISSFSMPLLDVYPYTSEDEMSFDPTVRFDSVTGLDRNILSFFIKNAGGKVGAATQMADILKEYGYRVNDIQDADPVDFDGIGIEIKSSLIDYGQLLQRDLRLATYKIATFSANLSEESRDDVIMTIGE